MPDARPFMNTPYKAAPDSTQNFENSWSALPPEIASEFRDLSATH
jgi:hypothetical protein